MSKEITSQTEQIIKNLQNLEGSNFAKEFINFFDNTNKPSYQRNSDILGRKGFELYQNALKRISKKCNIPLLQPSTLASGMRTAMNLNIFEYPWRKPFEENPERNYITPENSYNTAVDNMLHNISIISFVRLYPTLINKALQERTLRCSYYGFDEMYNLLVTHYSYIASRLNQEPKYILRVIINGTYGFFTSKRGYIKFTLESECPLKPFRIDINKVMDESKILYFNTDKIYVKNENYFNLLNEIKPVLEKYGIGHDVEHYTDYDLTNERPPVWRHFTGKNYKEFREMKDNLDN